MPISLPITKNVIFHLEKRWDKTPLLRPLTALATLIATLISPIFLLCDAIRWAYRSGIKKIPSEDHHYYYSTPISTAYEAQLKEFVGTEIKTDHSLASFSLVQHILQPVENKKTFHQETVRQLRAHLNNKASLKKNEKQFLQNLSQWIYTGPNLLPAMTDWLKTHLTEKEKTTLKDNTSSAQMIKGLHERLGKDPRFQGECFADYLPYDPRLLGDTPSHLFELHQTQIIRTPAVTREGQRSVLGTLRQSVIVEEFHSFLDSYEAQKQKHLYINLMAPHSSEKVRIEALNQLEVNRSNVFDLLTLSKDCAFYNQSGKFADQNDSETFKHSFIEQMFDEKSVTFHFPITWDREEARKLCTEAIDEIHTTKFNAAKILNLDQRKNFIEIAYTAIIEKVIALKKPKSCNISCRSCIDRGAVNLSLLFAKTQQLATETAKATLVTIAITPAILAQNRVMLDFRMKRLISALTELTPSSLT